MSDGDYKELYEHERKCRKIDLQEIERLQKLYDVAVADRVRMHEETKHLRAALERLDSLAQDPKNVRIMRKIVMKIAREALRDE